MDDSPGASDAGEEVPQHQEAQDVRGPAQEGDEQVQGGEDQQCAGEEERETYIVASQEDLIEYLQRARAGEDPELLFLEMYANSEDIDEDDCDEEPA